MSLRRTWLFVPGADAAAHRAAARSGADVIILELEDFTPPELRPKARQLAAGAFAMWRKAGAIAAVRINPLEGDGLADLMGVLAARPEILLGGTALRDHLHLVTRFSSLTAPGKLAQFPRHAERCLILGGDILLDRGVAKTVKIVLMRRGSQ